MMFSEHCVRGGASIASEERAAEELPNLSSIQYNYGKNRYYSFDFHNSLHLLSVMALDRIISFFLAFYN